MQLLLLLDVQFPSSCRPLLLLQLRPASEVGPCHDDSASSAWLLGSQQLLNLGQCVHLPQPQQLVRHLQATTAAQAQSGTAVTDCKVSLTGYEAVPGHIVPLLFPVALLQLSHNPRGHYDNMPKAPGQNIPTCPTLPRLNSTSLQSPPTLERKRSLPAHLPHPIFHAFSRIPHTPP